MNIEIVEGALQALSEDGEVTNLPAITSEETGRMAHDNEDGKVLGDETTGGFGVNEPIVNKGGNEPQDENIVDNKEEIG